MNTSTLKEGLVTKVLGQKVIFFDQTDSTNTQAKLRMEASPLAEGAVFITAQQTQGKGTDGNAWESGENNLSLSVIFNNDAKVNTLFPLYPAVALAKILREKYNIEAHVKWPNDVLVGKKKIAGILCEGVAGQYMVVGIGLNVNQMIFPESLSEIATSMKLEKRKNHMLEQIFQDFLLAYELLLYGNTDIRQEWLAYTEMIGRTISTSQNDQVQKVTVMGMSSEGFLQVKNSEGKVETWMARRGLDIGADY